MKIQNIKTILIGLSLFFNGLMATQPEECPPITIWVHGSKLTPTFAFNNFFYRMQGMHSALDYDTKYYKRTCAELLCEISPDQYVLDQFYFFGWNGKLCFNERKNAAKELCDATLKLIDTYKTEHDGEKPKIRIITHSHGGNVVLNLAKVRDPQCPLIVDELIMLCCPVQEKTKHLIETDCFLKVYAFYSGTDIYQIIDPQGLYKKGKTKKMFSERRFNHHNTLCQARVKLNGRSLMHIDFILTGFLKHLPALCKEIDHFYRIIVPSQITYEKILDVRSKDDQVYMRKKLKPA